MAHFFSSLFRTKAIQTEANSLLRRSLTAHDLTFLGIGAIVGAGIYVLTKGMAAALYAGPALLFSYLLAAVVCGFCALAYAELASSVGTSGSAYGYSYVGLGEVVAWIVGWSLLLEYGMAASAVAVGWSSYLNSLLNAFGVSIPHQLLEGPLEGGWVDLPAMVLIAGLAFLLSLGVKQTIRLSSWMVYIKLLVIAIFVILAAPHFKVENWHPFLPFGWQGGVNGAAAIFFAYIGFDAVSTAAEETINPQRNLPIGIVASLAVCAIIFMIVTAVLTGARSFHDLNVSSPVADVLLQYGYHIGGMLVAIGAVVSLTTVVLAVYYAFTRIFLTMAKDGLLPKSLVTIHPKRATPQRVIIGVGIIMALVAGLFPIADIAEVVNIGTLTAFTLVCVGVVVLRYKRPELERPFKTPGMPYVPIIGALACMYLMARLGSHTWKIFLIWTFLGLLIYFFYGRGIAC